MQLPVCYGDMVIPSIKFGGTELVRAACRCLSLLADLNALTGENARCLGRLPPLARCYSEADLRADRREDMDDAEPGT